VFACGADDPRPAVDAALATLVGRELLAVHAAPSLLEATFEFDQQVRLHLALASTEPWLAWAIGLPDGRIGVADQGRWELRRYVERSERDPLPSRYDPGWEQHLQEIWEQHQGQVIPPATSQDVAAIRAVIAPLLGRRPHSVDLAGLAVIAHWIDEPDGSKWSLWPNHSWHLLHHDRVVVAFADASERVAAGVARLEAVALTAVDLALPSLQTTFVFEQGYRLRLLPDTTLHHRQWDLYLRNHKILEVGPGSRWARREGA
jgi:hypothetical protein